MDLSIFRAYDVRGLYPTEINRPTCYQIARAYTAVFQPKSVAVGRDVRQSSPELADGLMAGFLDSGVDVLDIGEITTDMMYFSVGKYGTDGGIAVTASHNPGEYNGLKFVREQVRAISSDTGLFDIRDAIAKLPKEPSGGKGTLRQQQILDDYLEHVVSFTGQQASDPGIKIAANGNFGFVCRPVIRLAERLGIELVTTNFEPDGTFPKGPPDPMQEANQRQTTELVLQSQAAAGVAWDADADRVMFFDEQGQHISGAYLGVLLAQMLLQRNRNTGTIIIDPRIVWPARRLVKAHGGSLVISKGGHTFMKERMRKEDALFAGELSGHYYFRDNFYADNGVIPFLMVTEELRRRGTVISSLIEPISKGHFMSGEVNFRASGETKLFDLVVKELSGEGSEDWTDGFSVETKTWRLNIRPSNTEPLIRVNIEATEAATVSQLLDRVEALTK